MSSERFFSSQYYYDLLRQEHLRSTDLPPSRQIQSRSAVCIHSEDQNSGPGWLQNYIRNFLVYEEILIKIRTIVFTWSCRQINKKNRCRLEHNLLGRGKYFISISNDNRRHHCCCISVTTNDNLLLSFWYCYYTDCWHHYSLIPKSIINTSEAHTTKISTHFQNRISVNFIQITNN